MTLLLLLPLVTLCLALFFAFMLNVGGRRRKKAVIGGVRGSGIYKILYFFPQVLSIAIVALLFQFAYNPRAARSTPLAGDRARQRAAGLAGRSEDRAVVRAWP